MNPRSRTALSTARARSSASRGSVDETTTTDVAYPNRRWPLELTRRASAASATIWVALASWNAACAGSGGPASPLAEADMDWTQSIAPFRFWNHPSCIFLIWPSAVAGESGMNRVDQR